MINIIYLYLERRHADAPWGELYNAPNIAKK